MLSKLYENRNTILSNIYSILDRNKFILGALAVLICLLVIYAILRIAEYRSLSILSSHEVGVNLGERQCLDPGLETQGLRYRSRRGESVNTVESQVARLEAFTPNQETRESPKQESAAPDLEIRFLQPGTPEYTNLIAYLDREYLPKLNSVNIQARGQATFPQIRAQYLGGGGQGGNSGLCEQVTEDEQARVYDLITNEVLAKLTTNIPKTETENKNSMKMVQYIQLWLDRVWIAKGRAWLESGMPHTHGPCIIMSHDWLSRPTAGTLIHEIIHVHQRMNPADFDSLYRKWGFQRTDGMISGLEAKYPMYRVNPDGLDPNWIWTDPVNQRTYWIASLFTSVDPDSLKDTQYLAFPLAGDSLRYTGSAPIPLAKLTWFQSMFGIQYNNYHPNEIAAEFADHLLTELLTDQHRKDTPGFAIFKDWFGGCAPQADTIV